MPSKLQQIQSLAQEEAAIISASPENYMGFMDTAAHNYKYSYSDQLLIHAQRPETVACAGMNTWNKLGRWVNKGAKGIALLPSDPNVQKLRYVFAHTDTNSRAGREVHIWKFNRDYEAQATDALENSFGISAELMAFPSFLIAVSDAAAEDNLADYLIEMDAVKEGSLIEELDSENLQALLKGLIKNSVAYMALSRCGFDPQDYFDASDFEDIRLINTPQTIGVLGEASGDISRMMLREIELTVKSIDREAQRQIRTIANSAPESYDVGEDKNDERSIENGTHILAEGRLSAAGSGSTEVPRLGKYGMLRQSFLRKNRKGVYTGMFLAGTLKEHLEETDSQAQQMMDGIVRKMKEEQNVSEKLKAQDQMKWLRMMNNIQQAAEEIVLRELIYS